MTGLQYVWIPGDGGGFTAGLRGLMSWILSANKASRNGIWISSMVTVAHYFVAVRRIEMNTFDGLIGLRRRWWTFAGARFSVQTAGLIAAA